MSEKEKLALELLSLFPDGIHFEYFKKFYNEKEPKDKSKSKVLKKKIENFSDRDLKSLEDKSLIINTNQRINLQSIIGRFADYKFVNKNNEDKIDYYKKAYRYNVFILNLIENREIKSSISSLIFDNNINNFFKCLEYIKYLEIDGNKILFIAKLCGYFRMSSSPNDKIFERLEILKEFTNNELEKEFFYCQALDIDYFYGNFDLVYKEIQTKYPLVQISEKGCIQNDIERDIALRMSSIYGMEGHQYEEVQIFIKNKQICSSLFEIGEYNMLNQYSSHLKDKDFDFIIYELGLNTENIEIKLLKRYIDSLYKTQIIDKMQSSYTLLKVDKYEVTLREIKKLIITNPFTAGLKTLMLAIKDEKNCSKGMYEEAIKKLFHIKYYHVEAILLYCEYLKEKNDEDYQIWFTNGKSLATKHYYRYLLHRFNCLENGLNIPYDENKYPLPEKLDYSEIIKKYEL